MLEKLTENQWKILKNFAAFSRESDGGKHRKLQQNWKKPVEMLWEIM